MKKILNLSMAIGFLLLVGCSSELDSDNGGGHNASA